MNKVREGYKMTELGEIPNEWNIMKLSEVAEIVMGQSPDSSSYNDIGDGVAFFQGKTEFGRINPVVKKWCNNPTKISKPLDILISVRAPVGDVNINNIEACIGRGLGAIRQTGKSNYKYLYYAIQKYNNQLQKASQGSTFEAINSNDLKGLKLPMPLINEQEKIASILSTVDEQIDNVDALIEKNKELKKGLMQTLLTKGIGHTKFKKTEIGEIPEEWEVNNLGNIVEVISGATPKTNINEYWDNGDIYWATPSDITSNGKYISVTEKKITENGLRNCSAKLLPIGSILMSSRATIGERCINTVPMTTNQGFKSLVCKDGINNEFIYYYVDILKEKLMGLASGSTFLEVSKKVVEDIKVVIPSLEEQEKIASILSEVDKKIDDYENKKQKLEELKKGLMQQLLTGNIRV